MSDSVEKNKIKVPPLSYYLPAPVKPHTALHIPESHTLYIGPSSCTRRHAMHAEQYGDRSHVSFLFITEADVISGDYENVIGDAVETLLSVLDPKPYVFLLGVFCIDDFLGTDEEALLDRLSMRFPERQFVVEHIDPVTMGESKNGGMMKKHVNMYAFLKKPEQKDKGVNFVSSFTSLEEDCEFLRILKDWGLGPVRELFTCKTFEDYQDMAKSQISIGMRFTAPITRDYFEQELGIPFYYFPANYSVEDIIKNYREIADILGKSLPELTEEKERTLKEVEETVKYLDGMPVAIDFSAFLLGFSAAKALADYGFNLKYVFRSKHMFEKDEKIFEKLMASVPNVKVYWSDDIVNTKGLREENCLAIGTDAHVLLGTRYFADVWHDEGYFGLHGVRQLMKTIRTAKDNPVENIPEFNSKIKKRKREGR